MAQFLLLKRCSQEGINIKAKQRERNKEKLYIGTEVLTPMVIFISSLSLPPCYIISDYCDY
jgi:hypothetical protein